MLADHAIGLIVERGLPGVNFVTLAGRIGYTPQAIQKWAGTRPQLMVMVSATFGQRWQQWVTQRRYEHGALGLLPGHEDEVAWTRVLLALEEHGRQQMDAQPDLGLIFASLRECERWVFTNVYPGLEADQQAGTVERLMVLVDGLRAGLCRPHEPLPWQRARDVLAAECTQLVGHNQPREYTPNRLSNPRGGWG